MQAIAARRGPKRDINPEQRDLRDARNVATDRRFQIICTDEETGEQWVADSTHSRRASVYLAKVLEGFVRDTDSEGA